jgi:phosphate ABC transporter permease protein PstC
MTRRRRNWKEFLIERSIFAGGILSILFVLLIFGFVLLEALPLFSEYAPSRFFLGRQWQPTLEPPEGPWFGLLPNLWGSFLVTTGTAVFSVPLALGSAIYISEVAPPRLQAILKPTVELLASVPSVAIGFVGAMALNPFVKDLLNLDGTKTALAGSLMLAFMAIPTITTVAEDALAAVPRTHRDGSLALGATKWQGIAKIVFPAAMPGITAAVMLGIGRAIGEAIAVYMVVGNAGVLPEQGLWHALTHAVRTITATIGAEALEVGYGEPHYRALFMLAVILIGITFLLNSMADLALNRQKRSLKA